MKANPAYEEMEGIVAGVPRLAQYDVDIDAGVGRLATPRTRSRSASSFQTARR